MDNIELLNQIFRLCIVPLLSVLVTFFIGLIRKKSEELQIEINNDMVNKYIELLTEIVINCVIATNQTYVENLKNKNAFDAEAQKEAFNRTKEAVLALLTEEAKECLSSVYGDIGTLIDTLIESQVALNKSDKAVC